MKNNSEKTKILIILLREIKVENTFYEEIKKRKLRKDETLQCTGNMEAL